MANTAASGRLRAKTGTLSGVSALSGYVTTEDGEQLAFALVVNHARSVLRAREAQDSIGARLARLRRSAGTD
jgi:D-alanyl-D-alanine carboxypeptidase/D-alanyl-D-alanine-endopeptidase (penicillin-binding protein 4)